ncbi:peptidase S53 [Candidatus Acidianus copahuensis]|uniref:Peptidase S53 n=1 Tax=Candidatus Acidianus copahuensis TaxID=1160895 RepID=A0A031LVG7_9CREN|nr:protease pro-enzyme activation domain-containing protein [Candidatus Acidianus copahuensis]EZQ11098.1 peptidase S53 [Candidatus Acidianus copahuensis]
MQKEVGLLLSFFLILPLIPVLVSSAQPTYISPNINGQIEGKINPNTEIMLNIFVQPKNFNELYLLMQEIYNGQLKMSRTQLIDRFAPIQKVNEIVSYLSSQGFTIYLKTPFSIMAGAPAYKVEKTFNTTLALYFSNNETFYKPIVDPSIPSPLRNVLIYGLTNFTKVDPTVEPQYYILGKLYHGELIPYNSSRSTPLYGFQFSASYLTPEDFEGFYNVTGKHPGSNVTVAIIDAFGDPTIYQDVQQFDAEFNLPPVNLTVIPIGPYHPEYGLFTGWYEETALDVEAVHTMAPYANIELVIPFGDSFANILQAITYIVAEDNAQVVSMSFGAVENLFSASGFYAFYQGVPFPNYPLVNLYFALGSAEGITFVAASGDEGAYGGTYTTYGGVIFPSSSPFVLSVGGTSVFPNITSGYNYLNEPNIGIFTVEKSTATYGYETAWSANPLYEGLGTGTVGSDGGYSTFFPSPYWQRYISNSTLRATPDVAADANPYTGFIEVVLGTEVVIGGTSLSTQLWGGIIADIDSYVGHSLGLIAPILYGIYDNSTLYSEAFHEVTFGFNGKYYAQRGYNLVTGIGTPNVGILEQAVKDYIADHPSLEISISTFEQGVSMPWYMYNSRFNILAEISYPNGTPVTEGSFSAYIFTTKGYLSSVPLSFNGTTWIGNFTIKHGMEPNIWSIVVNGTSQDLTGQSFTDIDVGESINIITPVGDILPVDSPFSVSACIYFPNGTPVVNSTFTAEFSHDRYSFNITLLEISTSGLYSGTGTLLYPNPEGTYIMNIGNKYGFAYTYNYFGEYVFGDILTPINDGLPSVSPGENFTFLAFTFDAYGYGIFTSHVYAELIAPNGTLILRVPMKLAPDVPQFGVYNLFEYHEATITVPKVAPGFYKVVASSLVNTSAGPEYGNYTTFIYISPTMLNPIIKGVTTAVEGQTVRVIANITYPNGTEVRFGTFTATFVPDELNFESLIIGFDVGVPMQYNYSNGVWEATYQLPSIINGSIYMGEPLQYFSGPWQIIISGVSALGYNVISTSNFDVLPFTFIGKEVISTSNVTSIPMIEYNGTEYILQGVYSPSIVVMNVRDLVLMDSNIQNITVLNSTIYIYGSDITTISSKDSTLFVSQSQIGGKQVALTLVNSNVSLIATVIHDSKYAFNQSNSVIYESGVSASNISKTSVLPAPNIVSISPSNVTSPSSIVTLNISGKELKVISLTLGGKKIPYTSSETFSGITVMFSFNSSAMPDGDYIINLTLSDGLTYSLITTVYNSYHAVDLNSKLNSDLSSVNSSISTVKQSLSSVSSSLSDKISKASSTASISEAIGIIGLIIAIIAIMILLIFRRGERR